MKLFLYISFLEINNLFFTDEGDLKELLPADLLSSELQNDFLKIIGDDLGTSSGISFV